MKINKDELKKALEIVKPGLANRELQDQFTSFAFIEDKVVTYNDEISISHPVTGLGIYGAIRAEELYQLLSKLKNDEVNFELSESEILLTCGRVKAGLRMQQEILLPILKINEKKGWSILPANFLPALKFSAGSCSNDMSRPILTCVHVTEDFVEGSDGYCVSKHKFDSKMKVSKSVLLPASAVTDIIKVQPDSFIVEDAWMHFRNTNETVISCRLFSEDAYPETSHLYKLQGQEIPFPKTISDILDRAMVFSKRSHVTDESITVSLGEKRIKISCKNELDSWFEEEANVKYSERELSFNIMPSLLQDILKQTNVCIIDSNKIKFSGDVWEYVAILKN